ncbi:MAG: hypothetical protein AB1589_30820 [Cyanobacteriota bacterium]
MRQIPTKHLLNPGEVIQGRNAIATSADFSGMPVLLSLEQPPNYRSKDGCSAKFRSDRINNYCLHYFSEGAFKQIALAPTRENYHYLQRIGSDRWLLVRARASGYSDKNAHIYSSTGEHLHSFHAGEGIADVQVTENGHIWISFFDQGVFSFSSAFGQAGLICLDKTGNFVFEYDNNSDQKEELICDCYAMNVASPQDIWIYYYTDFPLAQISDWQVQQRWFPMPICGSHAFAVNKDYHALFDGGYGTHALFAGSDDKPDSLFLISLETMEFEELIPVDESGKVIKSFRAFGRGSKLFLYTCDTLSLLQLDMH